MDDAGDLVAQLRPDLEDETVGADGNHVVLESILPDGRAHDPFEGLDGPLVRGADASTEGTERGSGAVEHLSADADLRSHLPLDFEQIGYAGRYLGENGRAGRVAREGRPRAAKHLQRVCHFEQLLASQDTAETGAVDGLGGVDIRAEVGVAGLFEVGNAVACLMLKLLDLPRRVDRRDCPGKLLGERERRVRDHSGPHVRVVERVERLPSNEVDGGFLSVCGNNHDGRCASVIAMLRSIRSARTAWVLGCSGFPL